MFFIIYGFVAQIRFEAGFPLTLTESSYGNSAGNAKSGEAVKDCSADLDLGDLPIEVARA